MEQQRIVLANALSQASAWKEIRRVRALLGDLVESTGVKTYTERGVTLHMPILYLNVFEDATP